MRASLRFRTLPLLAAVLLAVCGPSYTQQVSAADPPPLERGRIIFDHQCAACHGKGPNNVGGIITGKSAEMLPGTYALSLKYKGSVPAALEDRTDLSADVLKVFVRNGIASMPAFRKTEISDADVAAVADYLANSAKVPGGPIRTGPNKVR